LASSSIVEFLSVLTINVVSANLANKRKVMQISSPQASCLLFLLNHFFHLEVMSTYMIQKNYYN